MSILEKLDRSFQVLKLIKKVGEQMKRQIHKESGDMNLTAPQGMAIGLLHKEGPLRIGDLSEKMALSNSTVSGILDRLEKLNYIERIKSPEDRRVVHVDLTESFRTIMDSRKEKMDDLMSKMIGHATEEEVETIVNGLKTLDLVINRYGQNPLKK